MLIKKTFKFCLRPNKKQREKFAQFAGACRWVYNRGLAQRTDLWQKEQKRISLFDQNNQLVALKRQEETTWLKDVHSQVLQQALDDLDKAMQAFFRRVKRKETPGYPRFRCKGNGDSFRYPQGVTIGKGIVRLPKIGAVRFRQSRDIEGNLKQTVVVKEGDKWYVCFSCEIEQTITSKVTGDTAGIDVGIENFATIANKHSISEVKSPSFLKKGLSHLRHLSRKLSKKTFKSSNWKKAKAKLNTWHAKIRHQRQDFLHKLSTTLVKNHDVIAVESLQIRELLMTAPKTLARAITDAGWRQFLQMLQYKCDYQGKSLVKAGKFFPSSQLCSCCGRKTRMELRIRTYSCECGFQIHRDHNAALNLRAAGMSVRKACGAVL